MAYLIVSFFSTIQKAASPKHRDNVFCEGWDLNQIQALLLADDSAFCEKYV